MQYNPYFYPKRRKILNQVFKVTTGLKAGGDCPDMWQECVEKRGTGRSQDVDDPTWAKRGQDIGRSFSRGW